MLCAAAALHAGIGLQRRYSGKIFSGDQSEILIPGERRNFTEMFPIQQNRERAKNQMQVFRVRNQRQKRQ